VVLLLIAAVGAVGIPVKAGLTLKTTLPDPVLVVTPVPPFATGKVPVTPVVNGKPVAYVKIPELGVPSAGVTKVGLVLRTTLPDPVLVVTPVPPLATARVPLKVIAPVVAEAGVRPVVPVLKEET
jgi:hypothetical protein